MLTCFFPFKVFRFSKSIFNSSFISKQVIKFEGLHSRFYVINSPTRLKMRLRVMQLLYVVCRMWISQKNLQLLWNYRSLLPLKIKIISNNLLLKKKNPLSTDLYFWGAKIFLQRFFRYFRTPTQSKYLLHKYVLRCLKIKGPISMIRAEVQSDTSIWSFLGVWFLRLWWKMYMLKTSGKIYLRSPALLDILK